MTGTRLCISHLYSPVCKKLAIENRKPVTDHYAFESKPGPSLFVSTQGSLK